MNNASPSQQSPLQQMSAMAMAFTLLADLVDVPPLSHQNRAARRRVTCKPPDWCPRGFCHPAVSRTTAGQIVASGTIALLPPPPNGCFQTIAQHAWLPDHNTRDVSRTCLAGLTTRNASDSCGCPATRASTHLIARPRHLQRVPDMPGGPAHMPVARPQHMPRALKHACVPDDGS